MDLSLAEVAQLLRVSRKTIYRWIREQKLPAYRMGRQYRFSQADMDAWLQKNRIVVPGLVASPLSPAPDAILDLTDLLRRGGIYYKVEGSSKEEAIANAVDAMVFPPGISRDRFLMTVLERERLASTAFGRGIAFPHPRIPFPVQPEQCSISICFLETPVDFDSLDGQFVSTLFFAFSPSLRHHLQLETKICHLCRDEDFAIFLKAQNGRRDIVEYIEAFETRMAGNRAG